MPRPTPRPASPRRPLTQTGFAALTLLSLACAPACVPVEAPPVDDDDAGDDDDANSSHYAFDSNHVDGDDSVSYSGQVVRHVLIAAMKDRLSGMTERLDSGWFPEEGEVADELDFYFSFDSAVGGELPHGIATEPSPLQTTFDDVSSGKNLVEKLAGNDPIGQHADWSADFVGWQDAAVSTPESLVRHWFAAVDTLALERAAGQVAHAPDGSPLPHLFVDEAGRDYQQLLQKFLLGALAFSQGADDYLDDDIDGKGLLSDNSVAEPGKPYTALEHAWDEGFGYFGAPRDFGDHTDDAIADDPAHDTVVVDGAIDLVSEYSWGHSANAAKRDLGAAPGTNVDLSGQAWLAFLAGRQVIHDAAGPLDAAELDALRAHRDDAVAAWESAIAATVVHYLNELLVDADSADAVPADPDFDFASYAKHWSEAKGFALSLQFNPRSPLSPADFGQLHALLDDAPALPATGRWDSWRGDLRAARSLLGDAYDFDAINLGDDGGLGGW